MNSLLCRAGDPLDRAANLGRLLDDPPLPARLGQQAGEEAARRYGPMTIARQTAAFHLDVIDRHSSRRRKLRTT